jgi:hypothetical protein
MLFNEAHRHKEIIGFGVQVFEAISNRVGVR